MEGSLDVQSTPGPIDNLASGTTLGTNKNNPSESSKTEPLGHQSGIKTGGNVHFERVIWCDGLDLSYNFGKIFNTFKSFGQIERIKAKVIDKKFINAFVTFINNVDAKTAADSMLNNKDMSKVTFSIISSRNVAEEESDYIPKLFSDIPTVSRAVRQQSTPVWFIVTYKSEDKNSLKGLLNIERYFGSIPKENFKRYGKCSLLKAKNELQALMLLHFTPSEDDNIVSIKPHNSFNLFRGVIYSEELHAFSEKEILNLCPENVYQVKKLNGRNNAILITFSCKYVPDYLSIRHLNFRIKKYRPQPTQCFNCFDYGHVADNCKEKKRCSKCSIEINEDHNCSVVFCYHCDGNHPPRSRLYNRFKFEQDIVEVAHNEYISHGKARSKIMGANKTPESTYAKVVSKMKINNLRNPTDNTKTSTSHQISNETVDSLPPKESKETPNSSLNTEEVKTPSVKPKSNFIFTEGFWSPSKPKQNNEASNEIIKNKRTRQLSPIEFDIEISNRFATLDPSTPLITNRPMKRMALSASCGNLSQDMDVEPLKATSMEEVPNTRTELDNENRAEQSVTSSGGDSSNPTPELLGAQSKVPSPPLQFPSGEVTNSEISPSPVMGRTGRLHQQPKPSKTTTTKISPSSILGKAGKLHHFSQPSSTKSMHNLSCGCNDCFHSQLNSMKHVSAKTLSNLVDNFIKYKTKNNYGKLEDHIEDCKCVDHLVRKQTSKSQMIKGLIENIKGGQRTQEAISETPSLKPKPNPSLGTQLPNTTKISRSNVMPSNASSPSH